MKTAAKQDRSAKPIEGNPVIKTSKSKVMAKNFKPDHQEQRGVQDFINQFPTFTHIVVCFCTHPMF
jgi:hypothetical protein